MKLFSFIKKLTIGALLLQSQTQGAIPQDNKDHGKTLLEDGAAHPAPQDAFFNPCEPFGFHLIAGNPTRNTTRWLIGEMHNHQIESEKCVKELLKLPGKTSIYIEGLDFRNDEIECGYKFHTIKSNDNVACFGWDDNDLHYELYESNPDIPFLERIFNFQTVYYELKSENELKSEKKFMDYLQIAKTIDETDEGLKASTQKKHLKKEAMYQQNTAKRLLADRKKTKSFDELFESYLKDEHFVVPKNPVYTKNHTYKRNKALIQTLRDHSNDHRSILIAGNGHFLPIQGDTDPKTRNYVSNALESDKMSYATLQFNPK